LGQPRITQRYAAITRSDEDALTAAIVRLASQYEVKGLRREAVELKEVVAELTLENRLLKKSMTGDGGDQA
jgi:transposase